MAERHPVVTHPYAATLIRIKARQLCRRTDFARHELPDLQQSMRKYLLEREPGFDPARGNVEAFITMLINTWVAMELRHRSREKRRLAHRDVSLDSTLIEHDGDYVPMASVLTEDDFLRRLHGTAEPTDADRREVREAIQHALRGLTAEQRELLADVVDTDQSTAAIKHGVSPSTVGRRLQAMRDTFRKTGFGAD